MGSYKCMYKCISMRPDIAIFAHDNLSHLAINQRLAITETAALMQEVWVPATPTPCIEQFLSQLAS